MPYDQILTTDYIGNGRTKVNSVISGINSILEVGTALNFVAATGYIRKANDSGAFSITAGTSTGTSTNLVMYGNNHASTPNLGRLRVDSNVVLQWQRIDNASRVGIGTTSPTHTLHVAGDINFTGTLRQNGTAFSSGLTTAGNGLTASGATVTLGTPATLTPATTNGVTASSHTHAITWPLTVNSIGSYVIASSTAHTVSTNYAVNTTVAGSTLRFDGTSQTDGAGLGSAGIGSAAGISNTSGETNPSYAGTWRLMSRVRRGSNSGTRPVGLWLRIS